MLQGVWNQFKGRTLGIVRKRCFVTRLIELQEITVLNHQSSRQITRFQSPCLQNPGRAPTHYPLLETFRFSTHPAHIVGGQMADADFQPFPGPKVATTTWLCQPRNLRKHQIAQKVLSLAFLVPPLIPTVFVHRGKPSIRQSEGMGAGFAEAWRIGVRQC